MMAPPPVTGSSWDPHLRPSHLSSATSQLSQPLSYSAVVSIGRPGLQSSATPGRALPSLSSQARSTVASATTAPPLDRPTVAQPSTQTTDDSEDSGEAFIKKTMTDIVQALREGHQKNMPSTRNISDSVIGLKKFSGSASDREIAESWLDEFLRYSEFRALNAADRLQLFKMLMREGAADWLSTLDTTKTASWERLLAEFKATYFKSPELKWAQARDLFHDPMRAGERVDDFVIRTRRAAKRLNLGDEMLHYAIINGLTPAIRNQVLAKGVTNLEDTLKTARIAECSVQTDPVQALLLDTLQSNKEIARQQSDTFNVLANQIQTLLDNPEVCMMRGNRQQEGPSDRGRPGTYNYSNGNDNQRQPTPVRAQRPPPRPTPRRVQQENYGRQQEQMSRRENQSRGDSNRFSNSNANNRPPCANCGLRHDQGRCPAFGQVCNACGRTGHFARACRSGRRV